MCVGLVVRIIIFLWVSKWSMKYVSGLSEEEKLGQHSKCDPLNGTWCDYSKWLYCHKTHKVENDGICDCLHPNRQIFDEIRNRCVGIPGNECNVYIGEMDCVANSYCSFNRKTGQAFCQCKSGFTQSRVSCHLIPLHSHLIQQINTSSPFVQNLRRILLSTSTTTTPTTPTTTVS